MFRFTRLFAISALLLVVSACASPPAATQEAAVSPTLAASNVTEEPTAEPTPEATATPQLVPQPITAANAASLAYTGLMELPRQPELASKADAPGIVGAFTPDGQFIALRSTTGVEVLLAADLSPVASYPGTLLNVLLDGRLAVAQDGLLVLIDPASGESEATGTPLTLNGRLQVSPSGAASARLVSSALVELVDLASGTTIEISPPGDSLIYMFFTGSGSHLLLGDGGMFWIYDAATGAEVYARQSWTKPALTSDGQFVVDQDRNGISVIEIATGTVVNSFAGGYTIERGCGVETCVDHLAHLIAYYLPGDLENAIVFWQQTIGRWNVGENPNFDDHYTFVTDVGVQNLLTAELKFSFPGYQVSDLIIGLTAPDGSSLLMIKTDGSMYLHSLTDGSLLASSETYTVGGESRFSPDGSQVTWSNLMGSYVYDPAAGEFDVELPVALPGFMQAGAVQWLANGGLATEGVTTDGWTFQSQTDFWDAATGTIIATDYGLGNCTADQAGLTLLCVKDWASQRIIKSDAPASVLFATSDLHAYTILHPQGLGYATCVLGAGTISVRSYAEGTRSVAATCQPMIFNADGTALLLQDGSLINVADGALLVSFEADADGRVFEGDPVAAANQGFFPNQEQPVSLFTADLVVVNDRVFDAASGALLADLNITDVWGLSLSADGLTLQVLTPFGIEQWQVLQ